VISAVTPTTTASPLLTSATGQGSIHATNQKHAATTETSPSQQQADARTITELAATDSKVRAHEAAHLAAAQGLATSGASFSYTTGPDGKRYAIGGEVHIDTSEAQTPAETLLKADQIRRAALAPANPSAQDLQVAAMAERMAANARLALQQEQVATYTQANTRQSGTRLDTTA